jgi:hypothetical protein
MRGITPEFVDMSKEILYPKFRVLHLLLVAHDISHRAEPDGKSCNPCIY